MSKEASPIWKRVLFNIFWYIWYYVKELSQLSVDKYSLTARLLLRLTKLLYGTGKIIILDSGFCILKGIAELCKKGVYSLALIKKCCYWQKEIPRKVIDERMVDKLISATDTISGKLEGVDYNLFIMKDKDFTIKLMSAYGKLDV